MISLFFSSSHKDETFRDELEIHLAMLRREGPMGTPDTRVTGGKTSEQIVKRILRKYGYPPDKQEQATISVLEQAEVLSEMWMMG